MIRLILGILFILPFANLPALHAGESQFVVFIHSGPRDPDDPVVLQIARYLAQRGFIVREPDDAQDLYGGPGVDYFSDSATRTAEDVAMFVSKLKLTIGNLPDEQKKRLEPRLQRINNPPTYLGVWLF